MKLCHRRRVGILLAVVLTLQMTLVSGIPAFAGETETPIVPAGSGVEINGLNLVLSGEIGLTYHVYVPKSYRSGTMKLECSDEEPIVVNIPDCPQDDSHRYTATYYLSAVELSEPVTLTVYDSEGNPLAQKSYSAADYVNLLQKDGKATEAEKNIGKALINYGHYAQLACSEANGWVIGEDLAETAALSGLTVDVSVFDAYDIKWQNYTAEFRRLSMSLRLDYKTGIHLYFPLDEKPTVTVKSDSMESAEAVEAVKSERLEGHYEIFIDGINALNLGEEYEVTVNNVTFTLSALSYCHLAVSHQNSASTVDAMRALYEFYQAVLAYHAVYRAE